MLYDRILIDISNMYYRAYCAGQQLTTTVEGKPLITSGIYNTLRMLYKLRETHLAEGGRMYYLFDNASSLENRRKDIDPEYKENRQKKDPVFYRGLDYLYLALQVMHDGDRIIRKPSFEADDLVQPVIQSFEGRGYKVLLVSTDMDWSRSISDTVHWMVRDSVSKKDITYTKQMFEEKYGFEPSVESLCFYKAIRGDASDNIPAGLKGIREEMLLDLIKNVKTVKNLFLNLSSLPISDKWKQALYENKGRILLNYQLVSFQPLTISEVREGVEITKFNRDVLGLLYRTLQFNTLKLDKRFTIEEKPVEIDDFFSSEEYPRE